MINRATLLGRVGKDPVIKNFQNGSIAEFSLATDDSYKDKQGNKVEQTDWHNIKVTGKLAEVAEKYIRRGMLLYVEGKIKTRSYDDKDGNKRYVTEIVCETFKMLDKKESASGDSGNSGTVNRGGIETSSDVPATNKGAVERNGISTPADDDLPFTILMLMGLVSMAQFII